MLVVAQGYPSLWLPFVPPWATLCLVANGHLLWAVPIKIFKIFQSLMFVSFSYRFHLPRLHYKIISATKPLAMGYLLFPIVLPWATFGYLLCDASCSPRVAKPLATFCSSLGYPLFGSQWSSLMGCPFIKLIKIFQSLMFVSFSYRFHLPRLH